MKTKLLFILMAAMPFILFVACDNDSIEQNVTPQVVTVSEVTKNQFVEFMEKSTLKFLETQTKEMKNGTRAVNPTEYFSMNINIRRVAERGANYVRYEDVLFHVIVIVRIYSNGTIGMGNEDVGVNFNITSASANVNGYHSYYYRGTYNYVYNQFFTKFCNDYQISDATGNSIVSYGCYYYFNNTKINLGEEPALYYINGKYGYYDENGKFHEIVR